MVADWSLWTKVLEYLSFISCCLFRVAEWVCSWRGTILVSIAVNCFDYALQDIIRRVCTLTAIDCSATVASCMYAWNRRLLQRVVVLVKALLYQFFELDLLSCFRWLRGRSALCVLKLSTLAIRTNCPIELVLVYLLVFCHVGQICSALEVTVWALGRFIYQSIFAPKNFLRTLVFYIVFLLFNKVRELSRLLMIESRLLWSSQDLRLVGYLLLMTLAEGGLASVSLSSSWAVGRTLNKFCVLNSIGFISVHFWQITNLILYRLVHHVWQRSTLVLRPAFIQVKTLQLRDGFELTHRKLSYLKHEWLVFPLSFCRQNLRILGYETSLHLF